ncbi:hypothetical protein ACJMK2_040675 [Sinanodonta woodiana]|uniref:Uncharacterized protein n=1 Tax=Sinanodonta woodiana TaxID=1069815 RepID=A0ABD3W1S1_SINWO
MKVVTALLILCACMPHIVHYVNAAGYIQAFPYGVMGSYGSGSGGLGGELLLLLALSLLFGLGGGETVIVTEDAHTRFANILIKRSNLTGQALETFSRNLRLCTKANKDEARCGALGPTCTYIPSVGLCLIA